MYLLKNKLNKDENKQSKKIILILTGSISVFKGINLFNILKKTNNVELIITKNVFHFLKKIPEEAKWKIFDDKIYDNGYVLPNHIKISKNADLLIVYPATANYIAKIANGICDDLATLIYSISNCKKIINPAMNSNMYLSNINTTNLKKLKKIKLK